MKVKIIGIVLALVALSGLLAGCVATNAGAPPAQSTGTPAVSASASPAADSAAAQAYVTPLRTVDLAFKAGGRVAEVLVKEGDSVTAGQTLLRLEDAGVRAALAQAEATLAKARAQVASTKAGPTTAQVAEAQAGVADAEAALAQVQAGPTRQAIAVAQARVATLQAQLSQTEAGTRPEDLAASEAEVKQAEAAVQVAQARYDKVKDTPEVGMTQQALDLQDATQKLDGARARHQALVNGPTPGTIEVLKAQLAEGQAALAQAKAGPTPQEIAQAQARVAQAQAVLANVQAGATSEEIAVAQAAVIEAQAGVDQAQAALSDAVLVAPFAGTVGALALEPGQYVAQGSAVLSLADLSGWKLQTDNLTETEVVRVHEGQAVDVTVDALPGETFQGTVTHIKPRSETKAGDVTYTVDILLTQPDARLRWGMTTAVQFK